MVEVAKKQIVVEKVYEHDDPKFLGDALEVSLLVDDTRVMNGDWYHDKIDHRIDGFLECLTFLCIGYEIQTSCRTAREDEF